MAEPLELQLSASPAKFVAGMAQAAAAAEKLLATILKVEAGIEAALGRLEAAAARVGAKLSGSLGGAGAGAGIGAGLDRAAKAAEGSTKRVQGYAKNAAKALEGIGKGAAIGGAAVAKEVRSIESTIRSGLGKATDSIFNLRTAFATLAVGAGLKEVVEVSGDFEAAIAQLAIVSSDSVTPIGELEQKLLALSQTTSVGLIDLTKTLADIIGTLPKSADQAARGFEILDAAQSAARASGASVEEVAKGLTATLNVYGPAAGTAGEITDKLFATFDQGGASVGELSSSLGQIVGIAKNLGISFDEVLGSIAVLTRGGQTGAEAITNLRQAYITVASDQKNIQDRAKKLGIEFNATALRTKGLVGVLSDLKAAGGEDILGKFFTDTQGRLAAATLLSAGLGQVRKDIEGVTNSAGQTDRALEKIKDNFKETAGIAKNQLTATLVAIGEKVLPQVTAAVQKLGEFLTKNREAIASGFSTLFDVLSKIAAFVVSNGTTILGFIAAFKISGVLSSAAEAAGNLAEKLADVGKGAEYGAKAGKGFAGGFLKSLGGLAGKVGPLLAKLGTAGAVLSAAYVVGTAIGNVIGDALGKALSFEDSLAQRVIKFNTDQTAKALEERARKLGFETAKAMEEARQQLESGTGILLGGEFKAGAVVSPGEAFARGATSEVAAAVRDLEAKASQAETAREALANQVQDATEEQLKTKVAAEKAKIDVGGFLDGLKVEPVVDKAVDKLLDLERQLVQQNLTLKNAQSARDALIKAVGPSSSEATEEDFKKKEEEDKKRKKAEDDRKKGSKKAGKDLAEEARKAAEREATRLRELEEIRAQSNERQARNEEAALQAAIEASDARLEAEVAAAEAVGESETAVLALRQSANDRFLGFIAEQQQAIRDRATAEVQQAAVTADERVAKFAKSEADIADIRAAFRLEEEGLEAESQERVTALRLEGEKRRDELVKAKLKAALQKGADSFDEPDAAKEQGTIEAIASGTTEVVGALENPIGALADAGLALAGPVGLAVVAIAKAPEILNGLADILRNGIAGFAEALAESVFNVLDALVNGLPEQLDKLWTKIIPGFIETFIAGLPNLIAGLIAMLPRLGFALIKLGPSIAIALVKGFGRALLQIFNLIPGSIKDAFEEAVGAQVRALGEAFADAGEAIAKPFRKAVQLLIDFLESITNAAEDFLFGGPASKSTKARQASTRSAAANVGQTAAKGGDVKAAISQFLEAQRAEKGIGTRITIDDLARIFGLDARTLEQLLLELGVRVEDGGINQGRIATLHRGGMVRTGSNVLAAAELALAGAPRFDLGGIVPQPGARARRALSRALRGDEVPSLLKAGEGVLNNSAMGRLGEDGLARLNRGQDLGGASQPLGLQLVGPPDVQAIMRMVVSAVAVDLGTPGGSTRREVRRLDRAPLMASFVQRR